MARIVRIRPYHFAPDRGFCVYVTEPGYEIGKAPLGCGVAYYGRTVTAAIADFHRWLREGIRIVATDARTRANSG